MPLQKSFSEQHSRSWRNHRNQQWQRSHSYAPRPQYPPPIPPPPPPPPVEISKTTKRKLKRFQFQRPPGKLHDDAGNSTDLEKSPNPLSPLKVIYKDEGRPSTSGPEDVPMAASPAMAQAAPEVGSERRESQRRRGEQTNQQSAAPTTIPAGEAAAATGNDNDSDKENSALPSTQPNKVTPPISATPEFLSIHVGTPRARFAWQDLAGTPDTPKIRESLGISPNAQLSWMTENAHVPSPVAPKQGTKRARSSSPPSSPSNSKSKKAALNVQKFKEALKTALANPVPPVARNRLSRHHTAMGGSTLATSGLLGSDPRQPAALKEPSPRGATPFRRTMSAGNPLPLKRRKVDASGTDSPTRPRHYGQTGAVALAVPAETDIVDIPTTTAALNTTGKRSQQRSQRERQPEISALRPPSRQRPLSAGEIQAHPTPMTIVERAPLQINGEVTGVEESMPDTESAGSLKAKPENNQTDTLSDYGDDLFDDDILAELDASVVPPDKPTDVPSERSRQGINASNKSQPEFDDLDDDDMFTAAEGLMADLESERQPTTTVAPNANSAAFEPISNVDLRGAEDDMEDVYGDDFGEDFDFDAAEKAATQAAESAAPWANVPNSSQKPRAIQRYLVTSVITSSYTDEKQRMFQEKASDLPSSFPSLPVVDFAQALVSPHLLQPILVVQGERTNSLRTVHLRGDWFDTSASVKSYVHVLGEFNGSGMCIVDNDQHMLILHPDQLISSTVVADSFSCTRRAVLQDRVKATSEASPALVYGTLLHEIFQDALIANQWSRSFLNGVIEKVIKKHLEDLYTIKVEPSAAREHLLTKTNELQTWAELFISAQPKADAIVQGRNGERVNMCVSKLLDVEEHVWSPMYGLKGNIDATVQVTMESSQGRRTLTVPFELKTGRNASSSHQAQTVLYNLLLSDRYDIEVVYGILYYMENSQMLRIPAIRHELRHMVMKRNELACYVRERSVQLPPMLKSRNSCGRCFAQTSCFIYHKLADDGDGETSGMGDKFDEVVGHLTPRHKEFFVKWEDLLTKEEKESQKLRRELWTMVSSERETLGRCFANVIIEEGSAFEDQDNPKINRFHYTFIKENPPSGFSFMDSQLIVGEPIVVSDEQGHFALALGYVTAVRKQRIEVAVDRRLHNARIRQAGFDEKSNQVFAGIMEASPVSKQQRDPDEHPLVRYRLDKDEFSNGMATVRNNLVQVMAGARAGSREIRQLVVDLVPPRFKSMSTQYVLETSATESLNVDQKRAIEKVMSAQDYALVLGMPGTGKTTTIAHIIRALVRKGKSVLLTSYTHTAVDNILLKLKTSKIPILRLGVPARVHPEVQDFAILAGEPKPNFESIRRAWHDPPVVATTCLTINHAIFNERTFDYCIVDEASQITLPICLGPIRMARTFVLVGDHNQLPPLVQNEEARIGGLDVSLFKLLSDTHPESVVNLEHQYRMCEDIMALSNMLIYNGRLKCGTEELRSRSLHVPDIGKLRQHHHDSDSVSKLKPQSFCPGTTSCWLLDLLLPERRVAFINTDAIEESREEAKGNRIINPCEARLVTQLVEGLLTVGIPASEIGVMTHYRSQLSLIKHHLRGVTGRTQPGSSIEIHTADRFQGRDKEVVVLSLVRNNEACSIGDLLKDWRRINVAFTRAKTKLLVIGSRSTLKGKAEGGRNNKPESAPGDDSINGEEMLARFIRLMEERAWIYDLPSDALDSHLFEEFPSTQAGSSLVLGEARSPVSRKLKREPGRVPLSTITSPQSKTRVPLSSGKENRQPVKRARIGEGALLKGKPILQGILNDMMGGKYSH